MALRSLAREHFGRGSMLGFLLLLLLVVVLLFVVFLPVA